MNSRLHTTETSEKPAGLDTSTPAPALSRRFCVGDWLVCPDLNRLQRRQGDLQRQLEPRLIHLLCYLAANPDRVLSRDELVKELWPRVIVNENSLTRAMSELRKHLALRDKPGRAYIETIPKKGYRLKPRVEPASAQPPEIRRRDGGLAQWLPGWRTTLQPGLVALSLALVISSSLLVNHLQQQPPAGNDVRVLADELLEQPADFFGGELTLSNAEDPEALTNSIKHVEAPVISNDETRYAYIQHDNSGSTIFLGRLDALAAPVVAVYNSPDKLFNLTWSPLGQGLMFARQAKLSTAALFADDRPSAELLLLDLATLEVHRMLPDAKPVQETQGKRQNLT